MDKDNKLDPDAFAALRNRFADQSRRAQAYYTVMHAARGVLGTDEAADAWMNAPAPGLGGRTPAELVGEGRHDEVLAYVGTLKA